MDALSLFSFVVFSRLSGKAFLPSSCFFFFYPLSITHHPHFVPEQLFPFFFVFNCFFPPLWWKHDSVLHLTRTDVNKYTPSSFFFCFCIPFVIYPLLSTPNSSSRYPSSLPPPSILFPPVSVNRGNLSRCSWNICVGSCLTHTEERRGENQGERGRVRGSTENLRKVAGCVCPCVIHHLWWRALCYSSFSTNKMIDMKNTLKCEKEKRG